MKKSVKFVSLLIASMLFVLVAGCQWNKNDPREGGTVTDPYANPIYVTIEMTDGGLIRAELYPNLAPETVNNFTKLVKKKFYNGLVFHRVIPGFMIQGGGFDENLEQKKADPIYGEFTTNGFKNELKHTRGVLSMARTSDFDSASSHFFIMQQDCPDLDGQFAAFGRVIEGMEVVDAIAETETQTVTPQIFENVPVAPQVIKTITIDK